MPACEGLDRQLQALLADRFGVPQDALLGWRFEERGEEVWVSTLSSSPDVATARPAGVRACRLGPDGPKPTSSLLVLLGPAIRSARVELQDPSELRQLLLGREIPSPGPPGFVALAFRGDVLGCGDIRSGRLRCLLPTGRRKDLLDLLDESVV